MGVDRPDRINAAFAAGFNARDIDALASLYAPDGAVVNPDGSISQGEAEVREHLAALVQLGGTMTSTNRYAIVNGDLALVGADFVVEFEDGRTSITGRSAEVLGRDDDGTWSYRIDHPHTAASPDGAAP